MRAREREREWNSQQQSTTKRNHLRLNKWWRDAKNCYADGKLTKYRTHTQIKQQQKKNAKKNIQRKRKQQKTHNRLLESNNLFLPNQKKQIKESKKKKQQWASVCCEKYFCGSLDKKKGFLQKRQDFWYDLKLVLPTLVRTECVCTLACVVCRIFHSSLLQNVKVQSLFWPSNIAQS